jgi:DNA-binding transcriptional LysR family regulator
MDLRQLETLIAVEEHRTFSAAARAMHTVQSNVSSHIARLERELGVALVDRAAQRLTSAGEIVVGRARRVQAELAALAVDVASLTGEVSGDVALGSIGTTARWMAPDLLEEIARRHPGVRVIVSESVTSSLVPRLLTGQLDMAVLNLPLRDPELSVRPLFAEEMVLVAPVGHVLAATDEPVSLVELADHLLLLAAPGTTMRHDLDDAAARVGVRLQARAEVDGVRLTASLAFTGYAPTIVPATAIPTWVEVPTWTTRSIVEAPRRMVGLATSRRALPSAPAMATADVLEQVVRDRGESLPGIHLTS